MKRATNSNRTIYIRTCSGQHEQTQQQQQSVIPYNSFTVSLCFYFLFYNRMHRAPVFITFNKAIISFKLGSTRNVCVCAPRYASFSHSDLMPSL